MNLRDFRIGWRLLLKEPAYSAVVILGLAVGIASCFLLLGFVRHSFSYDQNVPQRERVYSLKHRWNLASFGGKWIDGSSLAARRAVLDSGQPLLATFTMRGTLPSRVGDKLLVLDVAMVDPEFEAIFKPRVLAGDLHAALTRPDALALTRESALRLFGTSDAVGKSLRSDRLTYTVAAVVADQPMATTMPFDALVADTTQLLPPGEHEKFARQWGLSAGRLYVKLLAGADPHAVQDAIQRALRASPLARDFAGDVAALGGRDLIDYRLNPIADTYLDPDLLGSAGFSQHGDRQALLGLAGVAVLILLLAAANYVNLATVRTLARQREIAMRKVLGASASAVARQFLAESVLVCLIAATIGLLLAWLALPVFSDLVRRRFDAMFSPGAVCLAFTLALALGLAAGAYPAWSALRVRITSALAGRGASETVQGSWMRRALTVVQFAAAMGLTGTTLAVAWQTHYAGSLDPGFDAAPMLTFVTDNTMQDARTRALRDELARLPDVAGVTVTQAPFRAANEWVASLLREGGVRTDLNQYGVDPDFFDVYGLRPVAGRLYHRSMDRMENQDRIVINEAAARKLGFASPDEAVGKTLSQPGRSPNPRQIVGIAPAFRHGSAREERQAAVYVLDNRAGMFTVRMRGNMGEAKRAIEAALARYFPNEPFDVIPLSSGMVDGFYAEDQRLALLLAASSVIATGLAAFGIYVLAAYSVRRREKEIVLRKLYGAGGGVIGLLVAREFALLIGAGALIGLPLAWLAFSRYLAAFTERAPIGAWTILGALVVACAVALLSTLRHALAAMRVRPALALRE